MVSQYASDDRNIYPLPQTAPPYPRPAEQHILNFPN